MTFEGLNAVLKQLKKTNWRDQQALEQLIQLWPEIVGPGVAAQTRPVSLNAQNILQVATSSGVWAQNLAFERIRLLVKVRTLWNPAVKDIRFSPQHWHRPEVTPPLILESDLKSIRTLKRKTSKAAAKNAQDAFKDWAKSVRKNASQHSDRCPVCQCLTPQTELSRWSRCALCTSRPEA